MNCNEKPDDFPPFYWQMIQNYCEIKNIAESIDTPLDIRRQCIWLNKNITVGKKQIKWKVWREAGINIIHGIVSNTGEFLTAQEVEQKYNIKCNIMDFNGLKDAIPRQWRSLIKTMQAPHETINFKEDVHINIGKRGKNINLIKNNEIYWILVK